MTNMLYLRQARFLQLAVLASLGAGCTKSDLPEKTSSQPASLNKPILPPATMPTRSQKISSTVSEVQNAFNAEYATLYSLMKTNQKEAHQQGKHISVITGEQHNSSLSLVNQIMILDIARRLNIKNVIEEAEQAGLSHAIKDDEKNIQIIGAENNPALQDAKATSARYDFIQQVTLARFCKLVKDHSTKKPMINVFYRMAISKLSGMSLYAGDPYFLERGKYVENFRALSAPKYENAMVEKIIEVNEKGDSVAFYGVTHLPTLYAQLKQKGVHVLSIACISKNSISPEPFSRARLTKLKGQQPYFPKLLTYLQDIEIDFGYTMAMRASALHRVQYGELTKTQYQALTKLLNEADKFNVEKPLYQYQSNLSP